MPERCSPRQSSSSRKRSLAFSTSISAAPEAQRNNPQREMTITAAIGINIHQCMRIHPPRLCLRLVVHAHQHPPIPWRRQLAKAALLPIHDFCDYLKLTLQAQTASDSVARKKEPELTH